MVFDLQISICISSGWKTILVNDYNEIRERLNERERAREREREIKREREREREREKEREREPKLLFISVHWLVKVESSYVEEKC